MNGVAGRKAVGPDTMGAVGTARSPVFLRLERGVSGEELEGLGYKVTLLPRKARTPKAKAARVRKERRRRQTKRERLARRALAKRAYRVRQKERLGLEAMRAIWRAKRQRTKLRLALVGVSHPESPGGIEPPAPGPASATSSA